LNTTIGNADAIKEFKIGEKVKVVGKPNYYVKGGKLNFNVNFITSFGEGEIFKKFQELKEKLRLEGFFYNKKDLPENVNSIGVITSSKGAVIRDIIEDDLLNKYGIVIPRDVMMVIRAISMIDDIGKKLYPDFNTTEIVKPYAIEMMIDLVKPERLLAKGTETYIDLQNTAKRLPMSLSNLFDIVEDGKVRVALDVMDFELLDKLISKIVNVLVMTIITAAMLIASAMVMLIETDVNIMGYPVLGLAGFVFSAILGIILIVMILRRGNY